MSTNKASTFEDLKNLYLAKQYKEALIQLHKYILLNPKDNRATKLYQKVKEQIEINNIKKINEAITQIDHLYKEKQYKKLLNGLLQIQKFASNYKPLEKKIKKVFNIVHAEETNQKKEQYQKIDYIIYEKFKKQEFEELMQFLYSTLKSNNEDPIISKKIIDTKRLIIDFKLKENKKSLAQSLPETSYNFVKSLVDFEPTYDKTIQLLRHYYNKIEKYHKIKKQIYRIENLKQIKILYNQQKYKEAMQTAKEMLRALTFDKKVASWIKKCQNKLIELNFKTAYQKLNKSNS